MGGTGTGAAGTMSALASFRFVQIAQNSSATALGCSGGADGLAPADASAACGAKAATTVELLLNLPT